MSTESNDTHECSQRLFIEKLEKNARYKDPSPLPLYCRDEGGRKPTIIVETAAATKEEKPQSTILCPTLYGIYRLLLLTTSANCSCLLLLLLLLLNAAASSVVEWPVGAVVYIFKHMKGRRIMGHPARVVYPKVSRAIPI
ncbi:hypothetical protein Tco_0110475 [Tanacetum coccineum]